MLPLAPLVYPSQFFLFLGLIHVNEHFDDMAIDDQLNILQASGSLMGTYLVDILGPGHAQCHHDITIFFLK